MPEVTATPQNIQQLIDGDGVQATVILLQPHTDYPAIDIIDRHGLSIIGQAGSRVNGVEIEDSSYITLENFDVWGTRGSGVGMQWRPTNNMYRQQDIHISGLKIYDCGGGVGVVGDNITVRNCIIERLVQRGGDMDFFRVWGDNIVITNNILDGRKLNYSDAHVDAVQCWAREGDVDKWLKNFTFSRNTVIGGNKDIHQGVMFEGKRITGPITISNNSFSNIRGNTIVARNFHLVSKENNFINCHPGKAESSNGQIISIRDQLYGRTFTEKNGGKVIYEPVEAPEPEPELPPEVEYPTLLDIEKQIDASHSDLSRKIQLLDDQVKALLNRRYEVRGV